jgi:hypothetical protein
MHYVESITGLGRQKITTHREERSAQQEAARRLRAGDAELIIRRETHVAEGCGSFEDVRVEAYWRGLRG